MNQGKKILDMTCGSRTIWFDKNNPNTVFCDKRHENYELYFGKNHTSLHTCSVEPDVQCDFTDLPFEDNTFSLVIFDPPHLLHAKDTAWLVKKYGKLDDTWPQMLHDGFTEGMRVLKPDGVLIFKWSEYDIPAVKVWKAIGQKPLFGHHSGRKSKTFWGCFMKNEEEVAREQLANNSPKLDSDSGDLISRRAVRNKLIALVNEFEEILSNIREKEVDDSVCGLCEYDGAYIGQSGDWCNECPGFEKDDCFKLKEKYREEWMKIDG